jgi:hypothetical protein
VGWTVTLSRVELLIQLISWSTLSQCCLVSYVTYFTLILHFKAPYLYEPNMP